MPCIAFEVATGRCDMLPISMTTSSHSSLLPADAWVTTAFVRLFRLLQQVQLGQRQSPAAASKRPGWTLPDARGQEPRLAISTLRTVTAFTQWSETENYLETSRWATSCSGWAAQAQADL